MYGSETILYDTVMVDTCIYYASVKAYRTLQHKQEIVRYANFKKKFQEVGEAQDEMNTGDKKPKCITNVMKELH